MKHNGINQKECNNHNCIGSDQGLIQIEPIQPRLDFSHRKQN